MSVATVFALVEALRKSQVLTREQYGAVVQGLQSRYAEPRHLAKDLIQRGWLTPLQANYLLQGRGGELRLGSFLLLERLGEGGMGQVFKARHLQLDRTVALKCLRKHLLKDAAAVQRFEREAKAVARLSHPNIVTLFDAVTIRDVSFLVLEYAEGMDLARLVGKYGPLAIADACGYLRQAALGLQHAHERGLVHRDLKPHNLLLTAEHQTIKILDMGLARVVSETGSGGKLAGLTHEGSFMGTPDYVAPEQALDPRTADIRGDIYSLGCTLYHLLTGHPPFSEGTAMQKVMWHQHAEPPSLRESRPDVPDGLVAVVRRMMAKQPKDRPQTPAEVADGFAPCCHVPGAGGKTVPLSKGPPAAIPLLAAASVSAAPLATIVNGPMDLPPEADHTQAVPVRRRRKRGLLLFGCACLVARIAFLAIKRPSGNADNPGNAGKDGEAWIEPRGDFLPGVSSEPSRFGGQIFQLKGHKTTICSVAYSPDGRQALSGGRDGTLHLWDLVRGEEKRCLGGGTAEDILCLAFSPNGQHALSGDGEGNVRLWDLETGKELHRFNGHKGGIILVAFLPEKNRVLSVGKDITIRVWDTQGEAQVASFSPQLRDAFHRVATGISAASSSSDGMWIFLSCYNPSLNLLFDLNSRQQGQPFVRRNTDAVSVAISVAISPDRRQFLTGDNDGSLRLWDSENGSLIRQFEGHAGAIQTVAFSSDGKQALSGGADGTVRLWGLPYPSKPTDEPVGELSCFRDHKTTVLCVAFSPSGRRAISGGADETLRVWSLPR